MAELKICTKCKEPQPLSHYYTRNDAICGLRPRCKRCMAAAVAARKEKLQARTSDAMSRKDEKTCRCCGIARPGTEFRACLTYADGSSNACRPCEKRSKKERNDAVVTQHRRRLTEARRGQWCVRCQEDDPNVLEFDHLDPTKKRKALAALPYLNDNAFREELEKTQVLCVNCHRKKSVKENRERMRWRSGSNTYRQKINERNRNHLRMRKLERGGCGICGRRPSESEDMEAELASFDFDHTDRATKTRQVSAFISRGMSTRSIDEEIFKCRLLCASCHRAHSRRQLGWIDYGDAPSKGLSPEQLRRLSFARSVVDGLIVTYGQPRDADGLVSRPRLCHFILANLDKLKPEGL